MIFSYISVRTTAVALASAAHKERHQVHFPACEGPTMWKRAPLCCISSRLVCNWKKSILGLLILLVFLWKYADADLVPQQCTVAPTCSVKRKIY